MYLAPQGAVQTHLSPLPPSDTLLQPSSAALCPAHPDLAFCWDLLFPAGAAGWFFVCRGYCMVGRSLSMDEGGQGPAAQAKFAPADPCPTPPVKGFLVSGWAWSCCPGAIGMGQKEDVAIRQEGVLLVSHWAGYCRCSEQGRDVSEWPWHPQRDDRAPQTSASAAVPWGWIKPLFFLFCARNEGRAVPKYEHLHSPTVTVFDLCDPASHWKQLEFTKWSLESFANTWTLCVRPCSVLWGQNTRKPDQILVRWISALSNIKHFQRLGFKTSECLSIDYQVEAKGTLSGTSDVIISPFWSNRPENQGCESVSWMRYRGLRNINDLFSI